jgi:HD-GYP domain-containing protein (c-di-GMP phosphodiesterase class II)
MEEAGDFKKAFIVPVINGEYLIIATKKNRQLTKDELEYLHSFLDEVHIALTGAKYYAQKEAQSRFINALAELNKAAASLWETNELMNLTLKRLMELTKAHYGVFLALKDNQPVVASLNSTGDLSVEKLEAVIRKNLTPQTVNEIINITDPEIFNIRRPQGAFFKNILNETKSSYLIYFPVLIKGSLTGAVILVSDTFGFDQKEILQSIASEIAILFYNAKLLSNIKNLTLKTVESIVNAFDSANPYTKGHSVKVAKYATEIAREMGLSFKEIRGIQFAALLHDMGRIFIDKELINAPRRLNGEELNMIRRLPEISSKVVKNVDFFESIIPLIYHHKEHVDGSGYPSGLSGEAIPLGSRIIHAAESFVAMTSERPYRKALTVEEAVKEMVEKSGKQFDPRVVEALVRVLKRENPTLMFDLSALT